MAVDGFGATTEEMATGGAARGRGQPVRARRALRLAGRLEPLAGAWVGRAAAQFAQLMVRWDTDARSLNQALGGIGHAIAGSRGTLPAAGRRPDGRDDVHQQRAGLGRRRAMSIGSEIKVTFGALATAQSDVSGTASRITDAAGGPAAVPGADGRDLGGCGRTGLPGQAEAVGYGRGRSHRRARPDRRGARRRERRLPPGGAGQRRPVAVICATLSAVPAGGVGGVLTLLQTGGYPRSSTCSG